MKKFFVIFLAFIALFSIGCGNTNTADNENAHVASTILDLSRPIKPPAEFAGKQILVAFFSHTGENFEVGIIEKGNTHIIAEQIAELTKADKIFEIQTVTPYPADYQEMTKVAKDEQTTQARPEIAARVEDMDAYDIIFLGYPIWYHDLPMPVYTFLESHDFTGKTIIPFCTGSGSAMSGMEEEIPHFARGAQMRQGFGIQGKIAQYHQEQAKNAVANGLASLGYTN